MYQTIFVRREKVPPALLRALGRIAKRDGAESGSGTGTGGGSVSGSGLPSPTPSSLAGATAATRPLPIMDPASYPNCSDDFVCLSDNSATFAEIGLSGHIVLAVQACPTYNPYQIYPLFVKGLQFDEMNLYIKLKDSVLDLKRQIQGTHPHRHSAQALL